MNRLAILPAVLAVAAPAIAAAPAGAVQSAKFDISVSGSQVTDWTERTHQTGGDCKGRTFERGAGHETVSFASRHKARYKALGTNRFALLTPTARFGQFGIHSPGQTERAGVYVASKDSNGPCATPETTYIQQYDCATLPRHFNVSLVYDGRRLGLIAGNGVAPSDDVFNSCPIQNAADVTADGITDITAPFPARDLFDRRLGKQIVLGEQAFAPYHQNAWSTSQTTVKWKVTLKRVR